LLYLTLFANDVLTVMLRINTITDQLKIIDEFTEGGQNEDTGGL
jgi:hypothetical protein